MRNYMDESTKDKDAPSKATTTATAAAPLPPPAHKDSYFRTFVAIGVIALAAILLYAVFFHSGSGKIAGNKTPRALVLYVDNLDPEVLEAAIASNKAPNLKHMRSEGVLADCRHGGSCASGASFTEILTGVAADGEGSFLKYPSFLKLAKQHELRPAVIGSPKIFSARSGEAPLDKDGACSYVGPIDEECGQLACASPTPTCNANAKYTYEDADDMLHAAMSAVTQTNELILVEVDSLAEHSTTSYGYLSALYLADAKIGQLVQEVIQRTVWHNENWLVLVASSASADTGRAVFGLSTFGSATAFELNPLRQPVRSSNAFGTVTKWLNLGDSDNAFQGICSSGHQPPASCLTKTEATA